MNPYKIIDLKKTMLEDNDTDAEKLRQEMKEKKTFYVNIMSSPGAGKTSTILQTIHRLKETVSVGVMEADIDSAVDAETVSQTGIPCIQLHTGGMCHLDADMSRQGLRELEKSCRENDRHLDLVILENVGNL
ncbi:MAG: GTP-binding protein, partial [Anaerovoracaceae bacterium]